MFLLLLKSLLLPSSSASEDFFLFCIIHAFLFLLIAIVIIIIRPHRCTMYDAACCYRPSSVVCPSVGRSVTIMSCAKTAEPIEMPFGIWTRVGPVKHALCGVHSAHWRNLTNTIEQSMCGGSSACCQITLITCYYYCCHRCPPT